MSDHNWVLENLESYHAGGLNTPERERLEGHIAKCAACSQALKEIRGMDDRLEGLFSASRPEPGLEDRMIRYLRVGQTNFRLPVIGWIGLSAAAAVLLGILGAGMDYLIRDGDRIVARANLKPIGRAIHNFDDSHSMAAKDPDGEGRAGEIVSSLASGVGLLQYGNGDVNEMASRLRDQAVAKIDYDGAVAISGKHENNIREIMSGQDERLDATIAAAMSPDGKRVAAGGEDKSAKVWNGDTGVANGSMGVDAKDYSAQVTDGTSSTITMGSQPMGGGGLGLAGLGNSSFGGGGGFSGGGSFSGRSGGTIVGGGQQSGAPVAGYYPPSRALTQRSGGKPESGASAAAPAAEAPAMMGGMMGMMPKTAAPTVPALTKGKDGDGKETGVPVEAKYKHALEALERAQNTAQSGAMSSQQLGALLKDVEAAKKEVHTYRNDAVTVPPPVANEYFRPAEQAKADVEKLLKQLDKTIRSQTVTRDPAKKTVADASGGFATGLGNTEQKPGKPDTSPAAPRKIIIRSGEIEFEVDSFDSAVATVTLLVNKIQNGFIATVNSEKLPNGKVRGAVVISVPPESLDGLVLELRKELGKAGELKGQKIGSQDISKQYTDLESRLKAARAMEERLLQVIKSGKGEIKDLLAAEKELGVWRTKIEEFEGELRYYANQVALSTLTITLAEKEIRSPFAVIETERIQMGVEVEDVVKAQQQVLKAIEEAKGRVTKSELKQHAADQLRAVIHFEVAPDQAGPLRDRIEQLGRRTRLDIDRLQETEGGTGKPEAVKTRRKDTQFFLDMFNVANIAPRETVHLKLACVDTEDVYKKILTRVDTAKGRVVTSNLNRQRNDQTSGLIQFEVKSADAGAVLLALKELGEVMRLQVTENPDVQNVTRSKQGFNVELLALGMVQSRETTCIQLATRDVPAGYRSILDAVTKAKGQISVAQLNEQNKQNITAQLDFEIRRADEAAVSAAMTAAGDIFSRNVTRAADADNVVDSKVRWQVSLINQDQIPPRETVTLGIEVGDVDKTAAGFSELATANKGRTVESHVARERTGRTTAKLIFTVPLSSASTLVDKFRTAGTVRVQQLSKNPQVPEGELAVARLDVTLSNAPLIVASDEGFGPELRKGLSTSVKVLSLSLSWLLFGLLVILPWAVVIYVIYRLVMRLRRKAATA